jgi:hypothetical protein
MARGASAARSRGSDAANTWACKATSLCGTTGNFSWRTQCRACGRLPDGRPGPCDPSVGPAKSVRLKSALEVSAADGDSDDDVDDLAKASTAIESILGRAHPQCVALALQLDAARKKRRERKPWQTRARLADLHLEKKQKAEVAAAQRVAVAIDTLQREEATLAKAKIDVVEAKSDVATIRQEGDAAVAAAPVSVGDAVRRLLPHGACVEGALAEHLERVSSDLTELLARATASMAPKTPDVVIADSPAESYASVADDPEFQATLAELAENLTPCGPAVAGDVDGTARVSAEARAIAAKRITELVGEIVAKKAKHA